MSPAPALGLVLALLPATQALAQEADGTRDVGFVATPVALVTGMLDLAGVGDTDVVYDLGSGDGRIVIAAARRGARGIGVELDSLLVEESRASAETAGVAPRTEFRQADLFATDLRPGTRVVSQAFDLGDWSPDSVVTVRSREVAATPVHLWVIPADVAGQWAVTVEADGAPAERLRLALTQTYQVVRGAAGSVHLERVRLHGDSFAFSLGRRRFAGRVAGDEARGTVTAAGTPLRQWRAVRTGRR